MTSLDEPHLRPDQFKASLNFSTAQNYVLVNVPKAGNFTIKRSFAQHEFAAGNNSAVLDPETILEKNRCLHKLPPVPSRAAKSLRIARRACPQTYRAQGSLVDYTVAVDTQLVHRGQVT